MEVQLFQQSVNLTHVPDSCNTLSLCHLPREEPPNHVAGNVTSNVARAERASSNIGSLAELVAPRESKRIGNGQNQRNSYSPISILPSTRQENHTRERREHTNKRQPNKLQAEQRHNSQHHPQQRLRVDGQPEEATVGRVDDLGPRLAALKHPVRVARVRVDLVPPAQAHESAAGNIFEVVKVAGEEENGDDEDHDTVCRGTVVSYLSVSLVLLVG